MLPTPARMVDPSSMSLATCFPISRATDSEREPHLEKRLLPFNNGVDVANVDERITEGHRHLGIHLSNDVLCTLSRGLYNVDGDAVTAEPVLVGRGDLDECNIDGHGSVTEERRDVSEVDGSIVRPTLRDGFTACRGHKERFEAALVEAFFGVPRFADTEDVKDFEIGEPWNGFFESLCKVLRLTAA